MQPLSEITITRPWHWGIVIVGAPGADVPEVHEGARAVIGENAVVLFVRHAEQIDAPTFEGDWDWATATVAVRLLAEPEAIDREIVVDVVVSTPTAAISVGDADGETIVAAHEVRTRLIVSASAGAPEPYEHVRLDLLPVEG